MSAHDQATALPESGGKPAPTIHRDAEQIIRDGLAQALSLVDEYQKDARRMDWLNKHNVIIRWYAGGWVDVSACRIGEEPKEVGRAATRKTVREAIDALMAQTAKKPEVQPNQQL